MKTLKEIFVLIAVLLISIYSSTCQNSISCQMEDNFEFDPVLSGDCTPDPNGDWALYRNQNTYIPDMDPTYPLQNPPIKTIEVNFNIIQKDNGSGNYPDNQETRDLLNDIIAWVNAFYDHWDPSDPISWVTELPDYDSRIQFSIGEPGSERIYFYPNTDHWDDQSVYGMQSIIQLDYPERLEQLNVYIFGNPNGENWAMAHPPYYSMFDLNLWVFMFYWDGISGDYAQAGQLAHEFGHNLNLLHTYYGGFASAICNQNSQEFLQDVFLQQLPSTSNCPHTCDWFADADEYIGDDITNNLLGGNQSASYVSPMQGGQMHRSLAVQTTRKYVTSNKSDIPLVINDVQEWDFSIKLYRDLVIENNAHLTIKCQLVMHPDAKIIVKRGGTLTIDGGIIETDIYEESLWKGIEVWGNPTVNDFIGVIC